MVDDLTTGAGNTHNSDPGGVNLVHQRKWHLYSYSGDAEKTSHSKKEAKGSRNGHRTCNKVERKRMNGKGVSTSEFNKKGEVI